MCISASVSIYSSAWAQCCNPRGRHTKRYRQVLVLIRNPTLGKIKISNMYRKQTFLQNCNGSAAICLSRIPNLMRVPTSQSLSNVYLFVLMFSLQYCNSLLSSVSCFNFLHVPYYRCITRRCFCKSDQLSFPGVKLSRIAVDHLPSSSVEEK